MKKARLLAFLTLLVAAGLAVAINFIATNFIQLPSSLDAESADTLRFSLSLLAFLSTLILGSTGLFLLGLRGFKTAFRHSYYQICIGLIIGIVSILVNYAGVYLSTLNTTDDTASTISGLIGTVIGLVSMLVLYRGLRSFAGLLGLRSWTLSPLFTLVTLAVLSALTWLLPHTPDASSELMFDIQHAIYIPSTYMFALLGIVTLHIRANASHAYSRALLWFTAYFLLSFVAETLMTTTQYVTSLQDYDFFTYILYIVSSFVLLAAGLSFNKITAQPRSTKASTDTIIDATVFLASLASNPRDVDPLLDPLRVITAGHVPGQAYTSTDTKTLQNVFRNLETYLVKQEPLRSFDREALRAMIQEKFSPQVIQLLGNEPSSPSK